MPDASAPRAPQAQTLKATADAVAIGATVQTVLGESPVDGVVSRVSYTPAALITGAATNNRTLTVTNRGQTGAGATVVATLNFAAGVTAPADDAKVLTLGAAGNLAVVSGDVLTFESTAVGTGIVDPGGAVQVELARS